MLASVGMLETMARADLETLVKRMGREYSPGALETLTAVDPAWRVALEERERELGALYDAVREADATWSRWRRAMSELDRLWRRTTEVPAAMEGATFGTLEDVA